MSEGLDERRIIQRIRQDLGLRNREDLGLRNRPTEHPPRPAPAAAPIADDLAFLHGGFDICDTGPIGSPRKIFGPVATLARRVVRRLMMPVLTRQVSYNAANTRVVQGLRDFLESRMQQLQGLRDFLESRMQQRQGLRDFLESRMQQQQSSIAGIREELTGWVGATNALQHRQRELDQRVATLRADLEQAATATEQRLQAAAGALHKEIDHRTAALRVDLDRATLRQDRLARRVAAFGSGPAQTPVGPRIEKAGGSPPADGIDYAALEDRFRGSEAEIKDRQRRYLKYFHGREPVLDIGCGRGEFLELLCEAGIAASGVDADHDMILLCREKGLDVVNADAFERVAAIPDGSLGGVFCAQFIEHFRPETISRLTRLCYDKLRPGGALIFETINVACVSVFARSFYLDPTHVWPFHPELTRFLVEAAGFRDIVLEYLSPFSPDVRVPHVGARLAGDEAHILDASADVINELLFGHQDYAVVGIKPSAED